MGLHGVALVPPCGTTWCSPSPPMWDYMVYPLSSGAVTKSVYFPKAHWYDLHTLAMVTPGGTTKVVAAPVDFIPVSVLLCPCAMTTTQPPPPTGVPQRGECCARPRVSQHYHCCQDNRLLSSHRPRQPRVG